MNANGNLVARGSDTLTYDQANRLKSITTGGVTSTYVYDGDGKRASKTVDSATTSYVYDANRGLPVVVDDGTRKYVWGVGLAYTVDSQDDVLIYHTDGLGSVRALTDESGDVVASYLTDEFGAPLATEGTADQPLHYTGEQRDDESGLVYLRARTYDPGVGRFMSRDLMTGTLPIPLSLNRYTYVTNNPVNLVDPSGFSSNRVARDGSTDNDCFSSAGGLFGGNVVFAQCLDMGVGTQIVVAIINTPSGPRVISTVVFAKPPQSGGGGAEDRLRGRDALNQERRWVRWFTKGMTRGQREEFQRAVEEEKRSRGMRGQGSLDQEDYEEIRRIILGE